MRSASPTPESRRSTSATTSLRHTRDLQRKYNLENLELHQLPIESVAELGRSFDLVVCTGVLHHLPDPDRGLRALRDVLRPDGAMRLMVYARYGRAGIYMMQEYCRLLEIGASASDLRSLAATLDALPTDHPIADVLRRAKDFRRPEAMADALLHPQDRAYSVPEIYAWLDRCGMSFGRWIEQAPYLAPMRRPGEEPARRAARLAALARRSTPPSSFSAEPWSRIVSSRTATIAPTRASRSPSPATVGAITFRSRCPGRYAFGNVCLLAASPC